MREREETSRTCVHERGRSNIFSHVRARKVKDRERETREMKSMGRRKRGEKYAPPNRMCTCVCAGEKEEDKTRKRE